MALYKLESVNDFAHRGHNLRICCNGCARIIKAIAVTIMREKLLNEFIRKWCKDRARDLLVYADNDSSKKNTVNRKRSRQPPLIMSLSCFRLLSISSSDNSGRGSRYVFGRTVA